ncbi:60s ribosomal protein mitochondrial precursor protein, partial [Copromyces sp. CBS 386.78]
RKLKTWFSTTKNAYGTFKFQGDTLTWSVADINRPNEAAWLVCTGQEVFINTGAYLYQTPTGCADQTIHSYGGSTADL